jgi:hypothetical protein
MFTRIDKIHIGRNPAADSLGIYLMVRNQNEPLYDTLQMVNYDRGAFVFEPKAFNWVEQEPTFTSDPEIAKMLMVALMDFFGVKATEAEVSARLDEVRKSGAEQIAWLRKQLEIRNATQS